MRFDVCRPADVGNDGLVLLVVPSSPLAPRRPDPHFADEYEAARDLGLERALVDHDALAAGDAVAGTSCLPDSDDVVYRGWMLNSERYAAFDAAVAARGSRLRTTGANYRSAHELPGWIDSVRAHTAETVWTNDDSLASFDEVCRKLGSGPAVLRDYVKSAKHDWDTAVYIPDVADLDGARPIATRFRELRGEDFAGGFVVRRFERYVTAEVRTWWVDGALSLATPHPDTPDDLPEDFSMPPGLAEGVASLSLPFVTTDLARRDSGEWRLIEIGDGQVSDRPGTCEPVALLRAVGRRR